jgi:hypothetical protein
VRRSVGIASGVAFLLFCGAVALLSRGTRPGGDEPRSIEEEGARSLLSGSAARGASAGSAASGFTAGRDGTEKADASEGKSSAESLAEREARRIARRAAREAEAARKASEGGGADGEGGDPKDPSGKGVLQGSALTEAFLRALEENNLGALQGLLISELTLKGTKFKAEDLPQLFEALMGVEDYGLQKLVLTHLGRIDASPEELAGGYLEYLKGTEKMAHSDEIFKELVRLGADASMEGMTALLREHGKDPMRARAAQALGELGDARAVPALRQALYGMDDPKQGRPYVEALARLGGQEAIASLAGYCSRDGYESTLPVIREIRDPDAAPILAESLLDGSSDAYQRAVLAKLRTQPDPRILPDMARYLREAPAPMARDAIDLVGRIVDSKAVRVLEDYAARQPDPKLSMSAMRAAQRIRTQLGEPSPSPGGGRGGGRAG